MKWRGLAWVAGTGLLAGVSTLLYGALVHANQVEIEERTLALPGWPERLRDYRIAVLADLHLRGKYTNRLAERAVALALETNPDIVVLPGDLVAFWQAETPEWLRTVLRPLLLMDGSVVAVPGNHDYWLGTPDLLRQALGDLNIKLLRNESWIHDGITWVGVDSAVAETADPRLAMQGVNGPAVCLWHEPDAVDDLPPGCALMISGHSHGGQFTFPGGFTPMHTRMGARYPRGFYPHASTPLYVSRGVGTTGPPSRLNCPPEVSLLRLIPG